MCHKTHSLHVCDAHAFSHILQLKLILSRLCQVSTKPLAMNLPCGGAFLLKYESVASPAQLVVHLNMHSMASCTTRISHSVVCVQAMRRASRAWFGDCLASFGVTTSSPLISISPKYVPPARSLVRLPFDLSTRHMYCTSMLNDVHLWRNAL